jgi:hypothetical protein
MRGLATQVEGTARPAEISGSLPVTHHGQRAHPPGNPAMVRTRRRHRASLGDAPSTRGPRPPSATAEATMATGPDGAPSRRPPAAAPHPSVPLTPSPCWWSPGSSPTAQQGQTTPIVTDKAGDRQPHPADGAQALRQTDVGADLAIGYDGRLTINGIEIPEEQMVGARRSRDRLPRSDLQASTGSGPTTGTRCTSSPVPARSSRSSTRAPVDIVLRYFKDRRKPTVRWSPLKPLQVTSWTLVTVAGAG